MSSFTPTGSKIGVNINASTSVAMFGLLDSTRGSNDSEWIYCYVSGALSSGSGVRISQTGTAALWTAASVASGTEIGFSPIVCADGDYAWMARRGNPLQVVVSATCTLTVALYASDTCGALTTTATSGSLIGISIQTAEETTAVKNRVAVVSWPKSSVPGI